MNRVDGRTKLYAVQLRTDKKMYEVFLYLSSIIGINF